MAKIHVPLEGSSKLSPKFTGPYKIINKATGNKYKIQDTETHEVSIRHADDLKKTSMKLNLTHETHDEDEPAQADATILIQLEKIRISLMTIMTCTNTEKSLEVTHKDLLRQS